MSNFVACSLGDIQSVYGASTEDVVDVAETKVADPSFLDQYAPFLKNLLFDEDPRISYDKKQKELANYMASYKAATNSLSKNIFAKKINDLQAEIAGLSRQIESNDKAEAATQLGKIAGIVLIGGTVLSVLFIGNYYREKAATERWTRSRG